MSKLHCFWKILNLFCNNCCIVQNRKISHCTSELIHLNYLIFTYTNKWFQVIFLIILLWYNLHTISSFILSIQFNNFGRFKGLCNHHHKLTWKYFSYSQVIPCAHLQSVSLLLLPAQTFTNLLSIIFSFRGI